MVWRYKQHYTVKTLTVRNIYEYASKLRNFSNFQILKLLFPSIFCWYFRYFVSETQFNSIQFISQYCRNLPRTIQLKVYINGSNTSNHYNFNGIKNQKQQYYWGKPMKAQLVETRFPPNLGKYNVTSKYANKNITRYMFEKKNTINKYDRSTINTHNHYNHWNKTSYLAAACRFKAC